MSEPPRKSPGAAKAFAVAWSLPFTLVVPMFLGGALGFFLDRWLHTKPAFLVIFGLLGLAIGIRDALQSANSLDKNDGG
jgi:ATP synthase protein I